MRPIALTAAVCLPLLAGCSTQITDDDIRTVGIGEVQSLADRSADEPGVLLLIDPRAPSAYAAGHIPGAQNISLVAIDPDRRDPALEDYDTIVVYGDDPGSAPARAMVKKMMAAGYERVRFFAGGLREWGKTDRIETGEE